MQEGIAQNTALELAVMAEMVLKDSCPSIVIFDIRSGLRQSGAVTHT